MTSAKAGASFVPLLLTSVIFIFVVRLQADEPVAKLSITTNGMLTQHNLEMTMAVYLNNNGLMRICSWLVTFPAAGYMLMDPSPPYWGASLNCTPTCEPPQISNENTVAVLSPRFYYNSGGNQEPLWASNFSVMVSKSQTFSVLMSHNITSDLPFNTLYPFSYQDMYNQGMVTLMATHVSSVDDECQNQPTLSPPTSQTGVRSTVTPTPTTSTASSTKVTSKRNSASSASSTAAVTSPLTSSIGSSIPTSSKSTTTFTTFSPSSTTRKVPNSTPLQPSISTATPTPTPSTTINCTNPLNELEQIYCNITDGKPPTAGNIFNITTATLNNITIPTLTGPELATVARIASACSKVKNLTHRDFLGMSILFDSIIAAPTSAYTDANNEGVHYSEILLQSVQETLRNSPVNVTYLNGTNLALVGRAFDCAQSADVGGLSDQGTRFREGVDPEADASIQLQHATLCRANGECLEGKRKEEGRVAASRVFLHAFRSSKLFAGAAGVPTGLVAHAFATTSEQAETGGRSCAAGLFPTDGRVLSAVVEDAHGRPLHNVSGDAVLVSLRFARRHIGVPLHGSLKLSWWEGVRWSGRSCAVHTDHLAYVAHCTHLTDFTLLVDGMAKDPILCSDGLIIVNYFIIISSLVALAILNGVYIAIMFPLTSSSSVGKRISGVVPATAKDALSTTHSVLLFFFFFVFVIFSDESRTTGEGGCMVVAGLNYWLLTSCIMFSLFMSWKVLKVFAWTTTMENVLGVLTSAKIVYPVSIGVPSAFVIGFGAATKLDFFYRNDSFCWIRPDFIGIAVVVPLSILVVNALVCTFMMSLRLFPRWRLARLLRETSTTINRPSKRDTRERVVVLVLWQFTLGVPWLLQYLTLFSPGVTAWHFLFSIVLGSQGVVLFGSFCYRCVRSARTARGLYAVRTEQEKQHRSPRINGHRRKQTQNLATNST